MNFSLSPNCIQLFYRYDKLFSKQLDLFHPQ